MLNGGVGGVRLTHDPVVASYKRESRFKRIALMESRLDRQRRLRVWRHCINVLYKERRRVDGS